MPVEPRGEDHAGVQLLDGENWKDIIESWNDIVDSGQRQISIVSRLTRRYTVGVSVRSNCRSLDDQSRCMLLCWDTVCSPRPVEFTPMPPNFAPFGTHPDLHLASTSSWRSPVTPAPSVFPAPVVTTMPHSLLAFSTTTVRLLTWVFLRCLLEAPNMVRLWPRRLGWWQRGHSQVQTKWSGAARRFGG